MGGIWSLILMARHRYVWWNAILKMALLLSAMWNRKVVGWIFIALFLTGMVSQIGCSGEGGDNRWLHTLPVSRAQIVAAQYLLTAGRLMEVTLLLGLGSFLAQKYSFFPGVTLEFGNVPYLFFVGAVYASVLLPFLLYHGPVHGRIPYALCQVGLYATVLSQLIFAEEPALLGRGWMFPAGMVLLSVSGVIAWWFYIEKQFYE